MKFLHLRNYIKSVQIRFINKERNSQRKKNKKTLPALAIKKYVGIFNHSFAALSSEQSERVVKKNAHSLRRNQIC